MKKKRNKREKRKEKERSKRFDLGLVRSRGPRVLSPAKLPIFGLALSMMPHKKEECSRKKKNEEGEVTEKNGL